MDDELEAGQVPRLLELFDTDELALSEVQPPNRRPSVELDDGLVGVARE